MVREAVVAELDEVENDLPGEIVYARCSRCRAMAVVVSGLEGPLQPRLW